MFFESLSRGFDMAFDTAVDLGGHRLYPKFHPRSMEGRSPKWPTVRKHHLEESPVCVVSGLVYGKHTSEQFDVHHAQTFSRRPDLELDPKNLRTVVRPYHFMMGHFMNWKDVNPHFDDMVAEFTATVLKHRKVFRVV